jgi:hypothetical protein
MDMNEKNIQRKFILAESRLQSIYMNIGDKYFLLFCR